MRKHEEANRTLALNSPHFLHAWKKERKKERETIETRPNVYPNTCERFPQDSTKLQNIIQFQRTFFYIMRLRNQYSSTPNVTCFLLCCPRKPSTKYPIFTIIPPPNPYTTHSNQHYPFHIQYPIPRDFSQSELLATVLYTISTKIFSLEYPLQPSLSAIPLSMKHYRDTLFPQYNSPLHMPFP